MSTAQEIRRPGPRPVGEGTWFAGRAGLVMPAIVAVWSLFLLIGSLPDALLAYTPEGLIEWANPAAEEVTNFRRVVMVRKKRKA